MTQTQSCFDAMGEMINYGTRRDFADAAEATAKDYGTLEGGEAFDAFILADRLIQLGEAVKAAVKANATTYLEENYEKGTHELDGEKVTIIYNEEYEYPADKQLQMYADKLSVAEKAMKTFKVDVDGYKKAITERQKQLQEELEPVKITTEIRIAKK